MKTTITMNKNEIKNIISSMSAMVKSSISAFKMLKIDDEFNKYCSIDMLQTNFEELDKAFKEGKGGGFGNEHFSIEIRFNGDDVTISTFMSDELIVDMMNIIMKTIKTSAPYIGAFILAHYDEIKNLIELTSSIQEHMTLQDSNIMYAKYDLENIEDTAWGILDMKIPDVNKVPTSEESKTDEHKNTHRKSTKTEKKNLDVNKDSVENE